MKTWEEARFLGKANARCNESRVENRGVIVSILDRELGLERGQKERYAERLLGTISHGERLGRPLDISVVGYSVLNKRGDWETLIEQLRRSPSRAKTMNRSWEFAAER